MSIGLSAAIPILIPVSESILNVPLASISRVFPDPPTVILALSEVSDSVLASISIGLSAAIPILIPVAESMLNVPLASISRVFPDPPTVMLALSEVSIESVLESISIGLSAAIPILIPVAESILSIPLASISSVLASISMGLSAVTPILIPAESILNVPASISRVFPDPPTVILALSEVSIDNVLASISMGLLAAIPILIPVAILIYQYLSFS